MRHGEAAAERDAALFDVRTRNIQLDRCDALVIREDLRQLDVLVNGRAADVDEDDRAPIPQLGQHLAYEAVNPDSLQPDRVEHAGRRFDDAGWCVAFARLEEQAFDRDAAERGEIDDVAVLEAVSETAAGGNQRVGKLEGAD